jgi:hypothetical protein
VKRVVHSIGVLAALVAGGALGGCALPDSDSFRGFDMTTFTPKSTAVLRDTSLRPVTAEDLVGNDGRCGPAFATPETPADQPPGVPTAAAPEAPLVAGGISIDMTECDVVKRAGTPERVEVGTNERSERTATLTYIRGPKPGIYFFTSGRLTALDRAPEPPPAPKPVAKKKKPAPKKPAAT